MVRKIVVVGIFTLLTCSIAFGAVSLSVSCQEKTCFKPGLNQTPDLIIRKGESSTVTIEWRATENPVPKGYKAILYAGNPSEQQSIPKKGSLKFKGTDKGWLASHLFHPDELGRESFITAVILHNVNSLNQGPEDDEYDNEYYVPDLANQILDWRAFRLSTPEEQARRSSLPEPASAWSIDVRPAWLRINSGHGWLPRSRGNDRPIWWSLTDMEGNTTDLDLDGESTGVPGLTVQVSTPWNSRAEEEQRSNIITKLTGVKGHLVKFGELQWFEEPNRAINTTEVLLRYFYTVVTLYTNASVRSFSKKDVEISNPLILLGLLNPRFFSHETTARTKIPNDARFWSSYSEREYGTDPNLLELVRKHVNEHKSIPGLGPIQRVEGDGGNVFYHVGFYARVKPWQDAVPVNNKKQFSAGFVGLDVVAARAGHGGVIVTGSAGESEIKDIWRNIVSGKQSEKSLDLGKPPDGYSVAQPVAYLGTLSGNLPMIGSNPLLAERTAISRSNIRAGGSTALLPTLPNRTRFGVSANLRAGALIQKGSLGYVNNIVPINSYAQFVVKMTVAMLSKDVIVANNDVVVPLPIEFSTHTETPEPQGFFHSIKKWFKENLSKAITVVILLLVVALVFLIPGFRQFISSIFRLFAAFINKAASTVEGRKNTS